MDFGYSKPAGILSCLRHIIEVEGMGALFKGLGPTLVGVAPSRALYFSVYAKAKHTLNESGFVLPDSKFVHVGAACSAGTLCISVKLHYYSSTVCNFVMYLFIEQVLFECHKGWHTGTSSIV